MDQQPIMKSKNKSPWSPAVGTIYILIYLIGVFDYI